jgi:hypothetical protein
MRSPQLVTAGATKRYWRSRLANAAAGISGTFFTKQDSITLSVPDDGTMEVEERQHRYYEATMAYAKAAKQDVELRNNHIETLLQRLSNDPKPQAREELKSLRALHFTNYPLLFCPS